MKYILFAALATCLLIGIADDGHAFRCGSEVVTTGDSVVSLSARCGRPSRKEFMSEKFQGRWESVEKWFYNCGDNDFIYVLTIVHSKIVSDDSVGRGTGPSQCQGRR
jgi:hypothetical protein